jgi:uncharacterized protein (DUF1778 family)
MARPKADRTYSTEIRARVTPEQADLFKRAADHAAARRGTGTFSDWLREVLLTAARQELGQQVD